MPDITNKRYSQLLKKGFTLIELLVVITIIGILVSIAIASYASAQGRGRDARRKGDLDALKKALELIKQDSSGGTWYPNCDPSASSCVPNAAGTNFAPDLTTTYIREVPIDPSNSGVHVYTYTPSGCSGNNCASYTLRACLENENDTSADDTDGGTNDTCATTGTVSYTIANP